MDMMTFIPPGISEEFVDSSALGFGLVTDEYIHTLIRKRVVDAHKGTYGHALLVCGSEGMIGAAILATSAALRSGCGLVTVHIPKSERFPIEANCPSALFSFDSETCFTTLPADMAKYNAVGVGCGLGQERVTVDAMYALLTEVKAADGRLVIDADALNILAAYPDMQRLIPPQSVLTPHIGELKRLVGEWKDEEEKYRKAIEFAGRLGCVVIVKGPNSAVCNGGRELVFNSTGNSGMAKGGSGDVLTGFLTGLLARGYTAYEAAVLGIFLHGRAGDSAAAYYGAEGMNSADIIDFLADALKEFE